MTSLTPGRLNQYQKISRLRTTPSKPAETLQTHKSCSVNRCLPSAATAETLLNKPLPSAAEVETYDNARLLQFLEPLFKALDLSGTNFLDVDTDIEFYERRSLSTGIGMDLVAAAKKNRGNINVGKSISPF
jgi:hypothetical protein